METLNKKLRHWQNEAFARTRATAEGSAIKQVSDWRELDIQFLSEERIQISVNNETGTWNYAEMNSSDRRTGKPNRAWSMLKALAES